MYVCKGERERDLGQAGEDVFDNISYPIFELISFIIASSFSISHIFPPNNNLSSYPLNDEHTYLKVRIHNFGKKKILHSSNEKLK